MIAYLRDEEGADVVRELLEKDPSGGFAHAVNVCEVFYTSLRSRGEAAAHSAIRDIRYIGVHVREDLDESFWLQAGQFKVLSHMSLADAFAMSLAPRLNAEVVTSDRNEFGPVAQAGICRVTFIR